MLSTLRQERFVSEYLIDLNGQQAAIRSGYSPASAKVQASRLLTNDNVRQLIQHKHRETEQRLQIQRETVVRGFLAAAMEAKQQKDPSGMITAYREIGRLLGYYETRQVTDDIIEELSEAAIMEMPQSKLVTLIHGKHNRDLANAADEWVVK